MNKTISVSGMHCKSCEMLISDALEELGVDSVSADHSKGLVEVEFDPGKVDVDKINSAIEGEGFKVKK